VVVTWTVRNRRGRRAVAYLQVPYTLTVTNTGSVDYAGVLIDLSMPDGSIAQLALGLIPAGTSAETSGLAFVNTNFTYWRYPWLEDVNAYLARLRALDGTLETVGAKVTATDTDRVPPRRERLDGVTSRACDSCGLPLATFDPDPFVPNQVGTLTIELVNEGSIDAHNVYADARSIREWKTVDIPAGQTGGAGLQRGGSVQSGRRHQRGPPDRCDEASVYWDDQFNFGYGDTLAQWSGTAMVPVLEYTTAAQPPTVLPGAAVHD